jgi:ribokinase
MILVAGSANLDFVVRAAHIPGPGETVLGRGFQTFPGGKGANQAVACARAGGMPTHLLLALGDDAAAHALEASLAAAGVVQHVVRCAGVPSGCAFICLADDAENAITVAPGANERLAPADLPPLAGFTHLLLQLETPIETVTAYAQAARAAGVTVVLNAAPARALPAALLDAVDVLVVNEGELAAIAGIGAASGRKKANDANADADADADADDADADADTDAAGGAADRIEAALARVTVPTVIVTLGARGCRARHKGASIVLPAFAVEPVDTTAAGDTFCGALVAALSEGREGVDARPDASLVALADTLPDPLPDALRRASAAAALACTRLGAQASIPTRAEVDAFLAAQPTPAR